mgnify:CR=1 FL=1
MNKSIFFGGALLSALALGSCSSSSTIEIEQIVRRSIEKDVTFTAVAPAREVLGESTWTTFDGAAYLLTFDEVDATVSLSVEGLKYKEGEDALSFSTDPLPQSGESNMSLERGVNYAGPVTVTAGSEKHTLTDIRIYVMLDARRLFNGEYEHSYFISFTLDDDYVINAIPYRNYYFGTTKTSGGSLSAAYETNLTYYKVDVDPKTLKSKIVLYRPKFASNMPAFTEMIFEDIPVKLAYDCMTLDAPLFTPIANMGDGPIPAEKFPVSDLTGKMQFPGRAANRDDFDMQFTVGTLGTVVVDAGILMPSNFRL